MTDTTTLFFTYKCNGDNYNTGGRNDTARTIRVAMRLSRLCRRARNPGTQF